MDDQEATYAMIRVGPRLITLTPQQYIDTIMAAAECGCGECCNCLVIDAVDNFVEHHHHPKPARKEMN